MAVSIFHAVFNLIGVVVVAATLALLVELTILCLAAALPPPRQLKVALAPGYRLAVIVPAHNEEKLIGACVNSLMAASSPETNIYVVAHNCSDKTANRARTAGAHVIEFTEGSGRGKGVALHHGFSVAIELGADAVMVVDADSVVSAGLLASVGAALQGGSEAVQCRYVVSNPGANQRTRLMALVLLGVNVLRPRGRLRLGLSCGIFGNGFALRASTIRRVPYVANSVVEDLEYHLHLVRAGVRVDFLDGEEVLGEMPDNAAGSATQRARWGGGRMLMRRQFALPLFGEVLAGRIRLLEPLLDLVALPVASEAILLSAAMLVPLHWLRLYALGGIAVLAAYILVAASLDTQPFEDLKALAFTPIYLAHKIAAIPATRRAARRQAAWVRTGRNEDVAM